MVKFYENITSSDTDLLKDIQKEMDSGKPCAMTVYHPQCGHCTNMKPSWKRMGEHMSSKYDGDLVIALVHMDAIDELPIQRERIQGYPHIIFKTKESENEYHGPRDEESFENWIIDNAKNNKYQLIMNNNGNNGYNNNNNNDNNNNYNNNNDNHVDITNDVEILDTNFNNNSHMNDPISESEPTEEPEPNHIKSQFDNLIDSLNIYKTPSPMPRPDSNKDMSLSIKISRPETASKPKTRQLVRKSNKKPTRRMKTKSKSKAITKPNTKPNTKPKTKSKSVRATRSAKKAKTIRKRKSIMKKTPRKKLYTRKIPSTVKRNKRFHDLKTL